MQERASWGEATQTLLRWVSPGPHYSPDAHIVTTNFLTALLGQFWMAAGHKGPRRKNFKLWLHLSTGDRGAVCTNPETRQNCSNFPKLRREFGGVVSWFHKWSAFWTTQLSWWALGTTLRCRQDEQKWAIGICYASLLLPNGCSSGKHQLKKRQRGRSKVQEQGPYPPMHSSWEIQQQSRSKDWTLDSFNSTSCEQWHKDNSPSSCVCVAVIPSLTWNEF